MERTMRAASTERVLSPYRQPRAVFPSSNDTHDVAPCSARRGRRLNVA